MGPGIQGRDGFTDYDHSQADVRVERRITRDEPSPAQALNKHLHMEVDRLGSSVERLTTRLTPYLAAQPAVGVGEDKTRLIASSQYMREQLQCLENIAGLRRQLDMLAANLEL